MQKERYNPDYTAAVVNEGESFIYGEGEWSDRSDYIKDITLTPGSAYYEPAERAIDIIPTDNFSIKAFLVPTGSETPVLSGDANGDGKLDAKDVVIIMRYLTGREDGDFNAEAADFDKSGSVNSRDVIAIVQTIVEQ